jgi:hypothetical protein
VWQRSRDCRKGSIRVTETSRSIPVRKAFAAKARPNGDSATSPHIGPASTSDLVRKRDLQVGTKIRFSRLLRWPVVYRRFQARPEFNDLITATMFVTRWAFVDTDRSPQIATLTVTYLKFACGCLKFLEIS